MVNVSFMIFSSGVYESNEVSVIMTSRNSRDFGSRFVKRSGLWYASNVLSFYLSMRL